MLRAEPKTQSLRGVKTIPLDLRRANLIENSQFSIFNSQSPVSFRGARPRVRTRCGGGLRIILGLATAFTCCSFASETAPGKPPVLAWPPPPAAPCIIYERSITRPADIGAKPPAFSRLKHWLTGAPAQPEELVKVFGLAFDDAGNLLVTDTGANAVCCLDRARKQWLRWTQAGNVAFQSPVGIARHQDLFYVADSVLGRVVAFDEKGKLQFEITQELERPAGLAVLDNRLFIADSQRHQIVICDLRGKFVGKFGQRGSAPGQFNYPTHVAAGGGKLYVTDSLNNRLEVFDAEGRFQFSIGSAGDSPGHFSRPKGAAVDSAGHIYVVDALFDNVQVFDDQGRLLLNWGEAGSAPGQFWLPSGIAISHNNEIYVADSYNRRIQVFKYTGKP